MAVSKKHKGWRWDRQANRLDFYYEGARIGAIDSGGIDLAGGLTFEVNGTPVTGSTLDSAYDGGKTITVDAAAVKLDGSHGSNDTLQVVGAGTGALIDLAQSSTGLDVEGSGATWTVSKLGVAKFDSIDTVGQIQFTTDSLGADILKLGYDGTDFIWNVTTGQSLDLRVANTNVVTITGSAITLAQATTITTGGLTVSAGGITITGSSTFANDLTVNGNMTWGSQLTVDELVLDTDGNVSGMSGSAYLISDNTGDLTANALTGQEVHLAVNSNDELSVSSTEVDIHGNNLILDSDGNTYFDCTTGDTIKIYVNASQDFTITANKFFAEASSVIMVADDALLQMGDGGDGVLINRSTTLSADTALTDVLVTATAIDTVGIAANSLIISNITADGDIMVAVNDGGNSQTMIWCNGDLGEITINSRAAGTVHVSISNTDEYTFDATDFIIASGNNIKFAGDDGINDQNGNELIRFVAATTPGNYLGITNSNGGNILFENEGDVADQGFTFLNDQAEEILILNSAGTSVEEITITSGAAAAGATIKATTSVTNADLRLDTSGTGNLVIMLGGVDVLGMHDAGVSIEAANDLAGHDLYMQTEDGGPDNAANGGQVGALWEIRTGDGSAGASAQVGGAGGALTIVSGAGGVPAGGSADGGAGGALAITAGAGGAEGAGGGTGGAGASITLTAGAGGTGGGGANDGAPGNVTVGAGVFKFKRQTINMANAEVVLTLVPGVPAGTLLTGNILYVNPQGAGSPVLKLPPEGDCDGLYLVIENVTAGAEPITVQSDSAGSIVVCTQNETAYCVCNGTDWSGTVGVA